MHPPILIFGATKLARLACQYLLELGTPAAAYVVDKEFNTAAALDGLPVLDWETALQKYPPSKANFFAAVGYKVMRQRAKVHARIREAGYRPINIIAPHTYISSNVKLGGNNFIMPGVVIEHGAQLGDNNVVWSNSTICHDVTIGSHNFLAANSSLGGHVTVGDLNFIGFSAVVQQNIAIGNETLIGAQSLIRRATKDLHGYWGSPATVRKTYDRHIGITLDD